MINRLTNRFLPPRLPFIPLYDGQDTILYCYGEVDTVLAQKVSPKASIITIDNADGLLNRDEETLCVLLYTLKDALNEDQLKQLTQRNILVVAPVGHEVVDVEFPASHPDVLSVGIHNKDNLVELNSNIGDIDIYAHAKDLNQAATLVASGCLHYIQTKMVRYAHELKDYVLLSATRNALTGPWPPFHDKHKAIHGKHLNNRTMFVPTKQEPMLWNMPKDFNQYFFINKYKTKYIPLNISNTVKEVDLGDVNELPDFVELKNNVLRIDPNRDDIKPGIYQFELTAYTADTHQIQTFYIRLKSNTGEDIDYTYALVRIDGEYFELGVDDVLEFSGYH